MSFYEELSRYYDEIFAVDAAEMRFINSLLPDKGRLLDIGCATGNKTVLLSDHAALVEAFDLDEVMIERAKQDHGRDNIHYTVADMLKLEHTFSGRRFDAILCLGNTLVHALPPATGQMLRTIAGLLNDQGCYILQILNYDRIMREKITTLPLIDAKHVRFIRNYAWKNEEMHFVTALEIKESGQILHNDIVLYPLIQQELTNLLYEAGFANVQYYGSYQGAPWQEDSFITLAVCRKN